MTQTSAGVSEPTASTSPPILASNDDGVLTVRLNRPAAANARNQAMREALASLWHSVAADPAVRVVILTGAGDRFFCAGMDLKEAAAPEDAIQRRDRMRRSRDIELLAALPQLTVAAINGYALGGGLEMALACDVRLAADTATVGLPEVTHGLVPGGGGTQRLPRLIGYARACELVLSGRQIDASEALAFGIVSDVLPADQLQSAATELGQGVAKNPAAAVRYAKELLLRSQTGSVADGTDAELDCLLTLLAARPQLDVNRSATRSGR
jgi:enoyl-CoA hydratase/carnithine racemase